MKLPNELIDKIIIKLNDLNIAFELSSYATKKICEYVQFPIDLACKYGNLELVKYLYNINNKCSYKALYNACQFGHLNIVKYLYYGISDNNFKFHDHIFHIIVNNGDNSFKALCRYAYKIAIKYDKLEIVKFFNMRLIYDDSYNYYACKYGALNVVKCFYESNIVFSTSEMKIACDYDNIEVVKYLYKNGIKPNNNFMTKPAKYGRIKMLKYLHSIGVKPSDKAMIEASKNNHLNVVKYLYSIGFQFRNEFNLKHVTEIKHKKIIEYHVSN